MGLTQVSTDGVKNDAITKTKIPANQIEASELADNAVDTNAIANLAITNDKIAADTIQLTKIQEMATNHILGRSTSGTGNAEILGAGQVRTILNVADGANQTTINNNADNRVITGSGSANTLNGESSVVIDANSNLGIGTTSPDQKLKIQDSNNLAIHLLKTGSQDTLIRNTGQTEICAATGGASGQRIAFKIGANTGSMPEIAKFTPDGLCFGSDTAAANALSDYEEGTFTPSLTAGFAYAGTITYTQQTGHYTKIGNQVFAYIYLQPNGNSAHSGNLITDGNSLTVGGLPFTNNNTIGHEGGGYITYLNGSFGTGGVEMQAKPWVPRNQNYVIFHTPEDGNNLLGNETNLTNKYLIFHVRYHV